MPATLITAIGRGRKDDTGTAYTRTSYAIDGWPSPPTPFFAQAWLASPQGADIDRVHLIGTATSTWSALVEEYRDDDAGDDLWLQLEERCGEADAVGITDADLEPLAALLTRCWQRRVHCHVLCHREVDDDSAAAILRRLLTLLPLREADRRLMLDSTHGLRSLPLLALSAVQMADAFAPGLAARTTLLYGEFLGAPRGFALRSVGDNLRLADACRIWQESLDAEPLAAAIETDYPALAKSLRALSLALHGNAFARLDQRLRQVRNSLDALEATVRQPWQELLVEAVTRTVARLDRPTLSERLLALAELRAERHQYGLAILALAEGATVLACHEPVADYETMKAKGRAFEGELSRQLAQEWHYLFRVRNRIAHGANLIEQDGVITEQHLAASYRRCHRLVRTLIEQEGDTT